MEASDFASATTPQSVVLTAEELATAVALARTDGVDRLGTEILPDPAEPHFLAMLLRIIQEDAKTWPEPASLLQRLAEYRRTYPVLATEVAQFALMDLACPAATLACTPAPRKNLNYSVDTEKSTRIAGSGESPTLAKVGDLPDAVAREIGFEIVAVLGRGGYGIVYLARQLDVGHRLVVIKYTAQASRESQVLAALQHPNIMPVWSVHERDGYRVFCMPMHGACTLADVLKQINRDHSLPATGAGFLEISRARISERDWPGELAVVTSLESQEAEIDERELQQLATTSYIDAVVNNMGKLADALRHVHRRRVIHLDIKPANILVTREGEFMILDFGLAHLERLALTAEACGTVRYMAPEQLEHFLQSLPFVPTPMMDIYALGLVFFELLTGVHPFAESMGPGQSKSEWLAARSGEPPSVRDYNPAVPRDIDAIVRTMLQPDPAWRYRSAEDVRGDLQRFREHRPLLIAPNGTPADRIRRFRRRHPVFAVAFAASLLAVFAIGGFLVAIDQQKKSSASSAAAVKERHSKETAEADLLARGLLEADDDLRIGATSADSADQRNRAIERIAAWHEKYETGSNTRWREHPRMVRLDRERQNRVRDALFEYAMLAALAEHRDGLSRPADEARKSYELGWEWNRRAMEIAADDGIPRVAWHHACELADLTGRPKPELPDRAFAASPAELYLAAHLDLLHERYELARASLVTLIRRESTHIAGHESLGFVLQTLGEYAGASEHYQVAKSLSGNAVHALHCRGRLMLYRQRYDDSLEEFSQALSIEPRRGDLYLERAYVQYAMGRIREAFDDIDAGEARGGSAFQAKCLRVMLLDSTNRKNEADAERAKLDAMRPATSRDFISRAMQRAKARPAEAVCDLREATRINPTSAHAWRALGSLLTQIPAHHPEAIEALRNALRFSPCAVDLKLLLAIEYARASKFDLALITVHELKPDHSAHAYTLACVHALCARDEPGRKHAVRLLLHSIQMGFTNVAHIEADPDLIGIRDRPEVQKALKAIRSLEF